MEFFSYTLFYMNMRINIRPATILSASLLIGSCATSEDPMQVNARAKSVCPKGTTYSCTVYGGQTQKCICAEREELRRILNPVNDY